MSNFVVDPKNISPEKILADLRTFIASKPDADAWKDFFAGSAGATLTELVAGMSGFLAYQAIISRRESFLRYAQNRSSLIGHAQNRGYSIYRGQNTRLDVTITPTITQTLEKFSVIGSAKDTSLVILNRIQLVAGTPITIKCTIGDVVDETISHTGNNGPLYIRFKQPLVSEDISVSLEGIEQSTSKRITDAEKGNFVIQSNAVSSVDIFYLNDPAYTVVSTGNDISIKYVQYNSMEFLASDVTVDIAGIDSVVIASARIEPETDKSIVINAPLYSETQYIVRAREDYVKILRLLNPSIVDIGHRDISPMVVSLFYIKNDVSLLTLEEKEELLLALATNRNMGLQPPVFEEPFRIPIQLICNVKYLELALGIDASIKEITSSYQRILGKKIDFDEIENKIEDLDGVKIARIEIGSSLHSTNKKVQFGEYVNIGNGSNIIYRVAAFLYFSDSVEPLWPTIVGDKVTDGKVIWECKYLERQCDPISPQLPLVPPRPVWSENTNYRKGQTVIPSVLDIFEYVVVDLINKSGSVEPTWPALSGQTPSQKTGQKVQDNEILWQACPIIGTPDSWEANKQYTKGDAVVALDESGSDTVGLMFQAIGYLKETGSVPPIFPVLEDGMVNDSEVTLLAVDKLKSPLKVNSDTFYEISTTINFTSGVVAS